MIGERDGVGRRCETYTCSSTRSLSYKFRQQKQRRGVEETAQLVLVLGSLLLEKARSWNGGLPPNPQVLRAGLSAAPCLGAGRPGKLDAQSSL